MMPNCLLTQSGTPSELEFAVALVLRMVKLVA
jgi:hypothetical protein